MDRALELELGRSHVRVKRDDVTFTSKLIDGRFPDYEAVIPIGAEKEAKLDREVLRASLQRAAILSNEKYRGVRLEVSPGQLKISAHNPEQEEAQEVVAQVEQQAVEVVAHVLLRHGERGALDQFLERRLRHADALDQLEVLDRREIVAGQCRQGEAAAPGLHGDLVAGQAQGDAGAVGQGPDDLEQLARRDRGLAVLGVLDRAARHHFHFQVGARHGQATALDLHQQVGQHGQGLASLDDVDDLLQGFEEGFARQAETHA